MADKGGGGGRRLLEAGWRSVRRLFADPRRLSGLLRGGWLWAKRVMAGRLFAGRRRWWWLAGAVSVVAVAGGWLLWPSAEAEPPPRARQYLEFTACLLTGERGIADPAAAPVWAGMQDASLATRAKVQYLAIAGPQTVENGLPFLASLAQANCDLIFAAGAIPVQAVDSGADRFPAARFFPVADGAKQANVSPVRASTEGGIRAAVGAIVTSAVGAALAD